MGQILKIRQNFENGARFRKWGKIENFEARVISCQKIVCQNLGFGNVQNFVQGRGGEESGGGAQGSR